MSSDQVRTYVDSYEGRDVNPAGTPRLDTPRNPAGPRFRESPTDTAKVSMIYLYSMSYGSSRSP